VELTQHQPRPFQVRIHSLLLDRDAQNVSSPRMAMPLYKDAH
jgi:hypothetical protein